MTRPPWPAHLRRVVLVGVDFPIASGGSTYIESFGGALQQAGIPTEVLSIYPGYKHTRLAHRVVFKRKVLQAKPVVGESRRLPSLRLLPLVALKRVDRKLSLLRARNYLDSLGPETLIVITHVKALIILKESGFAPSNSRAILIGQHHSPFVSLNDERWLLHALPEHFSEMSAVTALSDPDAKQFHDLIQVPCYAIPNPSRQLGPQPHKPLLERSQRAVALARFSHEKRLDIMIDAFALAVRKHGIDGWKLEIFGEGPEERLLRDRIRDRDAQSFISLMGRSDDVDGVLRDSQLNLLSSEFEGFGLSILEAATHGVPSISFASSPGVTELMSRLEGSLVPSGDINAYSESIAQLLLDPALRKDSGEAALRNSRAYSGPQVVERWGAMLADLNLSTPDGA